MLFNSFKSSQALVGKNRDGKEWEKQVYSKATGVSWGIEKGYYTRFSYKTKT